MNYPDSRQVHPLPNLPQVCFIKNTVKNLNEIQQINLLLAQGSETIINQAIRQVKGEVSQLTPFYKEELSFNDGGITGKGLAMLVSATATNAVLNTNLDNMRTVGASFVQAVRRELEATLYEEIGPEEIAARLNKKLVGKRDARGNLMTRHGETIARTAYNAFSNSLQFKNVNAADTVAYYYLGPQDDRNRSFCANRVGKIWEKNALEAAIEAQPGATLHNPGGWNCRHQLSPISKYQEEAKPFLTNKERIEIFGE